MNKIAGEIAEKPRSNYKRYLATTEVAKLSSACIVRRVRRLFTDFQGILGVSADSVGEVLELAFKE